MNCQDQVKRYEEKKAEEKWLKNHEQKDNPANATLADTNGFPVEHGYKDPDKERENANR